MSLVWTGDRFVDADALRVPPDDRGFLLGDGVFDTFRVKGGAPLHLPAHLARLRLAASAFGIPVPFTDEAVNEAVRTLAARNGLNDAAGRLTLSRGQGPRGLVPPDPAAPFVLLHLAPPPPAPAAPLRLILSDVVRPADAPSSRHKTLSYIDNVEARRRAALAGCDDALMRNARGEIACASAANVFWIADGTLFTPALECGVLAGITRARILALAPERGMKAEQGRFAVEVLTQAEAVFLTNSVLGVVPVESLILPDEELRFDAEHHLLTRLRQAEAA